MAFFVVFFSTLFGVFFAFFGSIKLKLGPVRASAFVGIVIGVLWHFYPSFTGNIVPYCIFGGSLIGMVTAEKHINYFTLVLSTFVFSILFLFKSKEFDGLGGLLGITAMLSILASVGAILFYEKLFKRSN